MNGYMPYKTLCSPRELIKDLNDLNDLNDASGIRAGGLFLFPVLFLCPLRPLGPFCPYISFAYHEDWESFTYRFGEHGKIKKIRIDNLFEVSALAWKALTR